ncbi:Na(+)/H(+) exchange regulatory cofactor NHE-RF2 [Alosa sapidissima]|uniref:Na(+)/H(+) exchange regulatory cofactor NHE-RF2 n=1 Tax=Alosa sapidissima TaxID=34773 RepID=UPI001C08BA2A|nr:Na(+)/H(+) exchange regulatory cofactor NHE-RF2 [Alosa sapidissima]XP_041939266.1 Na(+)/H(+) exchange regulatory cofactor NHE-RF2 [Alosa sapidissima]
MAGDLKPRLCQMTKGDSGYGFHLHGEKGKSGQYIRKVEPNSPAEASGLRAGDRVVEVNGESVERETHHQVVQRIKALEGETRLLVVDRETDEYLRSLRLTCTEDMAVRITASSAAVATATSPAPSTPSPPPTPSKRHNNGSAPKRTPADPPKPTRRSPSRAAKKEALSSTPPAVRPPSELLPRLCHLVRAEVGYGFNLHSEKSRPGQYIRSLDPGSPADRAGLRPQDRLIEVNGVNIENMRHAEVVAFIKSVGAEARLLVVDPDTDDHFRRMGLTPTSSHVRDFEAQSITNGSPSPRINGSSTSHSTHSEISSTDASTLMSEGSSGSRLLDPFAEIGLRLSQTAAEAREKAHAKRAKKRAPQMDWSQKYELFSNF